MVGKSLKLDFSKVSVSELEHKRLAYHKKEQDGFFSRYQVLRSYRHKLLKGESIWLLAQKQNTPLWLLRQYNPTLNLNRVSVGTRLIFPEIKKK